MTQASKAIQNQITANEDIRGTVLSNRILEPHNTGASPVWECRVDIGDERILERVKIKAGETGERFYAERGAAVTLRRNAHGRFEIIGPSDRVQGVAVVKTYEVGVATALTSASLGFTVVPRSYEYYADNALYNDGVTDYPLVEIHDADGNPV